MKQMIEENLRIYLPIITGDMEIAPLAHIDQNRRIERQEISTAKNLLPLSDSSSPESCLLSKLKSEVDEWKAKKFVTNLIARIDPLLKRKRKNGDKIKQVIEGWLMEENVSEDNNSGGHSEEGLSSIPLICKEVGLDPSIFYKFLKEPKFVQIVMELTNYKD